MPCCDRGRWLAELERQLADGESPLAEPPPPLGSGGRRIPAILHAIMTPYGDIHLRTDRRLGLIGLPAVAT